MTKEDETVTVAVLRKMLTDSFEVFEKKMDKRFESTDARVDERFDFLDKKMDSIKTQLDFRIGIEVDRLRKRIDQADRGSQRRDEAIVRRLALRGLGRIDWDEDGGDEVGDPVRI